LGGGSSLPKEKRGPIIATKEKKPYSISSRREENRAKGQVFHLIDKTLCLPKEGGEKDFSSRLRLPPEKGKAPCKGDLDTTPSEGRGQRRGGREEIEKRRLLERRERKASMSGPFLLTVFSRSPLGEDVGWSLQKKKLLYRGKTSDQCPRREDQR